MIRADYANDNQGEYIYIGQATNYLEDLLSADALILVNGQSHIVYQGGEPFAKALEPLFADGFVQVSEFVDGRSSHQSQMHEHIDEMKAYLFGSKQPAKWYRRAGSRA